MPTTFPAPSKTDGGARAPNPLRTQVELVVDRLGHDGDGLAATPTGDTVAIRDALPGELLVASGRPGQPLHLETLLSISPDRVAPICRHVPVCGGCSLQHLDRAAALRWKSARVASALASAGFDPHLAAPLASPPRSRRRMDLAFMRDRGACLVGLHARASDQVVDLHECHILEPALFRLLAPLRLLLARLALTGRAGSIVANLLDDGPDLLLRSTAAPTSPDRAALASFATEHGVARISWQHEDRRRRTAPEPLATLRTPTIRLGAATVAPPPAAFLQATRAGEAAIIAEVLAGLDGLGPRARVIELYAGIGTLTFPLSTRARVRAIDGDAPSIASLARAAGGMRIETTVRDLARAPLAVAELAGADAIVLDPPFAGAGAQMGLVAASGVPTIILVSCNPAALRREAAMLHSAGYALARAQAIDQFLFSAHVESVSTFRREKKARGVVLGRLLKRESSLRSRSDPSRSGS